MAEEPRIEPVDEAALAELDRALWQGRTLRGLRDAASPQIHRDLLDTIVSAGWRPRDDRGQPHPRDPRRDGVRSMDDSGRREDSAPHPGDP